MKAYVWLTAAVSAGTLSTSPVLAQLTGLHSIPLPADAAKAADVRRGGAIMDRGGANAQVVSIDGERVTIATGKSRVVVPVSALHTRAGTLTLSTSIAELDTLAARRTVSSAALPAAKLPDNFKQLPAIK